MILKQVVHDVKTNAVEATWVDGGGVNVRCHSYADTQMADLEADIGADVSKYATLISVVKANIKPPTPTPIIIPSSITMRQARLALLNAGLLAAALSLDDAALALSFTF